MSPEQAAGERHLDGRADVYSLSCVLYEMLVGEPPYTGPTVQAIIAKQFSEPVPSARRLRETVPRNSRTHSLRLSKEFPGRVARKDRLSSLSRCSVLRLPA